MEDFDSPAEQKGARKVDAERVRALIAELLVSLGEDPTREGLVDTPRRVAGAYEKLLEGYGRSLEDEITTFKNVHGYSHIIVSGQIDFVSLCEHHLLPFYGYAHIGYIPGERIVGLSKLSRVVDIFSRRLQDQERITMQVVDELMSLLEPKGVAVMLTSKHMCNIARGVEKKDSYMTTVMYRGVFADNPALQQQLLELVKLSSTTLGH